MRQLAGPRYPACRLNVRNGRPLRHRQQQGSESEQPSRRRLEDDDRAPRLAGADFDHFAAARRDDLRHRPDVIRGDVDRDALLRLVQHAVGRLRHDLRP